MQSEDNSITPSYAYPEGSGSRVQFWLKYQKIMRLLREVLPDDKDDFEKMRPLVIGLPLKKDTALGFIDKKIDRMEYTAKNLRKLDKTIEYITEGDVISALRKIIQSDEK